MSEKEIKIRVVAEGQQAIRQFESVGRSLDGVGDRVQVATRGSDGLSAALGRVAHYGVAGGALWGIGHAVANAAGAMFDASAQAQRLGTQLQFATGNSAQELAFVAQVADRLGLQFNSTAQAYAGFAAAARGTALEGQKARDSFEAIAKASAVMGLSADQTQGALLAVQQMMSKGVVSAEEFRGQLGERMPIALQAAADAMGMTTAEFTKMMESGEVVTADFLPKFADALNRMLGDAAEDAAGRFDAAVNRMGNAWDGLKRSLGDSGVSSTMATAAGALTNDMRAIGDAMDRARERGAGFFGQLNAGVATVLGRSLFGLVQGAANGLNGALNQLSLGALDLNSNLDLLPDGLKTNAQQAELLGGKIDQARQEYDTLAQRLAKAPDNIYIKSELHQLGLYIAGLEEAKRKQRELAGAGAPTGSVGSGDVALARAQRKQADGQQQAASIWAAKYADNTAKLNAELSKYRQEAGAFADPKVEAAIRAKFEGTKRLGGAVKNTGDAYAAQRSTAQTWADAMQGAGQIVDRLSAQTDGLNEAQVMLRDLMASPQWADMPAQWQDMAKARLAEASAALEQVKSTHAANIALKAQGEAVARWYDERAGAAESLQREIDAERERVAAIGMGTEATAALAAAKLDEAAASDEARAAALRQASVYAGEYRAAYEQAAADANAQAARLRELARLKTDGAAATAVQAQIKAEQDARTKMWESIDQTAHDVFVNIFEDGAGTFKRLGQTLKAALLDWLYQMTVKKWIVNIQGQFSGGGTAAQSQGGGAAGGGSGFGGLDTWGGAALQAYGGYTAGASAASLGYANMVGAVGGDALGALIAGNGGWAGVSAGGAAAGSAAGAGGAAAGGGIMSSLGAAMPYIAGFLAIASLISGLDDSGTYHTGGVASAGPDGVRQGTTAESLGMSETVVADATTKAMEQTATSMAAMFNSLGKGAFNVSTAFADDTSKDGAWGALRIERDGQKLLDWNDGRTSRWAPKEFADGEKGLQQYTAALAVGVRDALEQVGLPGWATGMLDALGDAPTFEQISGVMQSITVVDQTMATLGRGMSAFANISDEAVTALAEATGGIANLQAGLGYFYQEFFSEAERLDIATAQLTEGLAALGQQLPETRAEFKDMVNAAIEAGDEDLAAKLLAFSGAVASILPATEDATAAAAAAADDAEKRRDQALQQFEQRIDREKGLWQQQADAAEALRGEVQGLFDVLAGHITDLRAQALGPVLNAQQGQAFIDQALAAALGAGVLPDQAGLETAITAVRGGLGAGAGQYGNSIEASYAAAKLAGDLETLQGVAGQQLTQAERQYQAAVTQIDQLDQSLDLARDQLDLTQVGIDATLGVKDAIHELTDVLDPSGAKRGGSRSGSGQSYIMGGAGRSMTFADGTSGWVSEDHSGGSYRWDEESVTPGHHQYLQGLGVYTSTDSQDLFGDLSHLVAAQLQAAFWSPEADQATTLEKWAGEMFYGSTEAALAAVSGLIDQGIIDSYRGLPQLAVGTNYIPQDGAYYLHKGESVQPVAYNPAAGGVALGGGTQRLEALVEALLGRIARLEGVIAEGNAHGKATADTLARVAPGDALVMQPAPTF